MKPDITLIFPDSPFLEDSTMFPPLGIMYISSYLKHFGKTVQCLDMALGHKPKDAKADLIGISFTTPQRESAFELIRYFKEHNKVVVVGGPHPTHMQNECLQAGADKVFPGYGEHALLEWMTGRSINPLGIDDIPYPDRNILPIHEYKQTIDGNPDGRSATVLMTARGCPFRCAFCSQVDNGFYHQSAQRTIDEILHVKYEYGFTALTIYDDSFTLNKPKLFQIADVISKEDMKFRCFSRTNTLDEEVCAALAKMGVIAVGIGVESGSNTILSRIMKGTTRDINTRAVQNLQKFGIEAKAFLIVGLPGETVETIHETMSWLDKAQPESIGASIFQPLPGSVIFKNPAEWGINFQYNGQPLVYRGKRGEYVSNVRMNTLSPEEVVQYHAIIEDYFKEMKKC